MTTREVILSPVRLTGLIITLVSLTTIAILLDVPVLQQLLGFVYVAFLPGFLLLRILRLDKIELTVKTILVVGLSAAFFMIFGLIFNSVFLATGLKEPLATIPLLISFNVLILGLAIFAHLRNSDKPFVLSGFHMQTMEKLFLILPFLFPTLSILGARLLNSHDNNALTILFLIVIIAYVILIAIFRNRVPARIYPVIIYSISLSLLLMLPMRSDYIVFGADTGREYYFFMTTLENLHWDIWEDSIVNTCLSVTILPSIYQSLMDLNPDIIFKFFPIFLFSFSPLVIYVLSKRYVGNLLAFLASFFYMTQPVFLYTAAEVRINVCAFFISLALLTIIHRDINLLKSSILFLVFFPATMLSYYAGSFIIFFIITLAWSVILIFRVIIKPKRIIPPVTDAGHIKDAPPEAAFFSVSTRITASKIALSTIILFLWHGMVLAITFRYGVLLTAKTFTGLDYLFDWETKNPTAPQLLGQTVSQTTISHQIEFIVYWATFILIGIGVIAPILKYKSMVAIDGNQHTLPDILKTRLNHEFLAVAVACSVLTVSIVVLPYLSNAYEYQRLYIVVTIVLASFFIIGGMTISRYIKLHPVLLVLLILIPYFISMTGLLDQSFGIPRRIIMNSTDSSPESLMVPEIQDVKAAVWLGTYSIPEEKIYLYGYRREVLQSYGPFFITKFRYIGPKLQVSEIQAGNDYIFLSTRELPGTTTNSNDFQRLQQEHPELLEKVNIVYMNGTSGIMK